MAPDVGSDRASSKSQQPKRNGQSSPTVPPQRFPLLPLVMIPNPRGGTVAAAAENWNYDAEAFLLRGREHRIGKDRRKFAIFAWFDVVTVTTVWLFCVVTHGGDFKEAFRRQVDITAPDFFEVSLFDMVIMAALRMLVLNVSYALLLAENWCVVAGTTTVTTVFIAIKILFFFSHEQGVFPQYLLFLISLAVAWFELWLMPFYVLRREGRYQDYAEMLDHSIATTPISGGGQGTPHSYTSNPRNSAPRPASMVAAAQLYQNQFTDDEFRSALEWATSDEEGDAPTAAVEAASAAAGKRVQTRVSSEEDTESRRHRQGDPIHDYDAIIESARKEVEALLESQVSTWRVANQKDPEVRASPTGTHFFVSATFTGTSAKRLFNAIWRDNVAWNKQVTEAKSVRTVDADTEVFYSISAPALRGYISPRDFLDVRRVIEDIGPLEEPRITGFFRSLPPDRLPPHRNQSIVRGENLPSMLRVRELAQNECKLEWIAATQLNGSLPKRMVQSAMVSFFADYVVKLREYLRKLEAELQQAR